MFRVKPCSMAMIRSVWCACVLFYSLFLAIPAFAQGDSPLTPVNRSSPGETYQSLIAGVSKLESLYRVYRAEKTFANLRELRYEFGRLRRLLDLREIPEASQSKQGNEALTYLADILDRLPAPDVAAIPGAVASDKALPARWDIPGTDIEIARIDSGPDTGLYLITAESIANLADYYQRVRDLPAHHPRHYASLHLEHINATGPLVPDWLVTHVPDWLKQVYLNTPAWKIVAIVCVIAAMLVLACGWVRVVQVQSRRGSNVQNLAWRFTLPVMFLAIYYLSVWFVIAHINPAGFLAQGERLFATMVFYGLAAWAAWIGCFLLAELIINTPRISSSSLDTHLLRLAARLAAIGSAGGCIIYGANQIGIPAYGLITGIGIGGIALALAAQSTLENLFGGVALFADRPFRIGDTISFGGERGSVEMVGTRSTRIRALDGTLVTVPNGDLAKMKIVNLTRRDRCLLVQTFALHIDTPAGRIRRLLEAIRALMADDVMVEKTPGWPRVRCVGVAIGHIEVEVRAYVLTTDYTAFLEAQETLLLQIIELIEQAGVKLARPVVAPMPEAQPQGFR